MTATSTPAKAPQPPPGTLHLVTGGAGFIGSNLIRGILAQGGRVRVLDDLSSGKRANLTGPDGELLDGVELQVGALQDPEALARAVDGVAYVHHHAAQVSVPASVADPNPNHDINVTGTMRLFEAARAAGVRRVVYAASCAIYGNDPKLPKVETDPIDPVSPYAASKYMGEVYGQAWTATMGLEVVSLRYFNVFGARQSISGGYAAVIPVFIARLLDGAAPVIHGDGLQTRDFVHVDNVVAANLAARTAEGAGGQVFNVGTGVETSILDLAVGLAKAVAGPDGEPMAPQHVDGRVGDVRRSVADITRTRRTLGYEPAVGLQAGLDNTLQWYRAQRDADAGAA